MKNQPSLPNPRPGLWRVVAVASVIAIGLLFLACSSSDDDSNDGATTPSATEAPGNTNEPEATTGDQGDMFGSDIDPCSLVTREEAESALGASVAEPVESDAGVSATCSYSLDPSSVGINEIRVTVWRASSEDELRALFEIGQDLADPVEGVGDEAYWGGDEINVWYDANYFSIYVDRSGVADELPAATDFASMAVGRLP